MLVDIISNFHRYIACVFSQHCLFCVRLCLLGLTWGGTCLLFWLPSEFSRAWGLFLPAMFARTNNACFPFDSVCICLQWASYLFIYSLRSARLRWVSLLKVNSVYIEGITFLCSLCSKSIRCLNVGSMCAWALGILKYVSKSDVHAWLCIVNWWVRV